VRFPQFGQRLVSPLAMIWSRVTVVRVDALEDWFIADAFF
jgi:hypothetical protein